MSYEIRPLKWRDWKQLAALFATSFPDVAADQIRYQICKNHRLFRVCVEDDELLGFVLFYCQPQDKAIWLDYMAVSSAARGRGLGAELLTHMEFSAPLYGGNLVRFTVDRDNHHAIALYHRRGYEEIDEGQPGLTFQKPASRDDSRQGPPISASGLPATLLRRTLYPLLT